MFIRAFILSLFFLVYFFETISVFECPVLPETQESCSVESKECNTSAECSNDTTPCEEEPIDCSEQCFNCPLFYTMELPEVVTITTSSSSLKKIFPAFSNDHIACYHAKAWKPPDFI